jgi:small GTP-binding protein
MSMETKQLKRKVLLLGDGAVGKTSLIRKFVTDKFDDKYITTIGTKVTKKDLRIKEPKREVLLTLLIWDILGQKGYKSVQASSYKGGEGVLLVCDLTRRETLGSLKEYWIPELQKVVGDVPFVFVGNKSDLVDERQITEEELKAMADEFGSPAYLSSAKTGENVEEMFKRLGEVVISDRGVSGPAPSAEAKEEVTSLLDVADRIINDFAESFGDRDTAMAAIRQQFSIAGVNIERPEKKALLKAVELLAQVERGFKDDFEVKTSLAKRRRLIEQFG